MATITDNRLYDDLRQTDVGRAFWINEDPPLYSVQAWIEENCE